MPSYCTNSDVYRESGLTSTQTSTADVDEFIDDAEAWLESFLQTAFTTRVVTAEKYDGSGSTFMFLKRYPILSLTSLSIDGVTVTTSNVAVYNSSGRLLLKSTAEKSYFVSPSTTTPQNVIVSYTYGTTTVPRNVKKATAKLAAMNALAKSLGGSFGSVLSYQLPELSVTKNPQHEVWRTRLEQLEKELQDYYFGMNGKPGVLRPQPIVM